MNKAGIAAVALVAVAAAGSAGAWYTGTQLEGVLQKNIDEANAELRTNYPGSDLAVELVNFERGIFSSQARYRAVLAEANEHTVEETIEIFFANEIQHGPVPLSRLVRFKWLPVMAVMDTQLESSEMLEGLFTASGGKSPMTAVTTLGYGKGVYGKFNVAPLKWSEPEYFSASFSGLSGDFETDRAGDLMIVDGRVDSVEVNFGPEVEELRAMNLVGWDMSVNRKRDASTGLYLGTSRAEVDQFSVVMEDLSTLVFNDMVQSDLISLESDGVSLALKYRLGAINYGAEKLGSMDLDFSMSRVNPQAIVELGRLYNGLMLSFGEGFPEQAKFDELNEALDRLLEDGPKMTLNNFVLKTANGESRLNLGVGLGQLDGSIATFSEADLEDLIQTLDANLVLSKTMIRDVIGYRALFDPSVDKSIVEQEAEMAAEMIAAMAEMFQLGRVEGDNIISQLSYANGAVTFNGQAMELEELMGLMAGMQ